MLLSEINMLLKQAITQEELEAITPAYYIMDLPTKQHFADVVEVVGVVKLARRKDYYNDLLQAKKEQNARLKYEESKRKLARLEGVRVELLAEIEAYERSGNNVRMKNTEK